MPMLWGEAPVVNAIVGKIGEMVFQRIGVEMRYAGWVPQDLHDAEFCHSGSYDGAVGSIVYIVAEKQSERHLTILSMGGFAQKYNDYHGLIYIYVDPNHNTNKWQMHKLIKSFRHWLHPVARRDIYRIDQTTHADLLTLGITPNIAPAPKNDNNQIGKAGDPSSDDDGVDYF